MNALKRGEALLANDLRKVRNKLSLLNATVTKGAIRFYASFYAKFLISRDRILDFASLLHIIVRKY